MATDDPTFTDSGGSRDYSRVLLVLVCLLAILVAASALPVLAPQGTQSPIASLVPVPEGSSGGTGSSTAGPGSGSLGALSPGQQTSVGGSLGGREALRSQSAEVHFVVRSTESAYWRTGAYGTYTGAGWERSDESRAYSAPIETRGMDGRRVSYEVELNRTARSLPTVWRPETVSREDVRVTGGRAVRAESALPAGATYTGVSNRPPSDPGLLRSAGTDYPAAIEDRYTRLPAITETRLGPVTDGITANASNPYETATRVENWLEANKEYDLNVSQPPENDVASEFVREMDAGYCEYFATSMVAMLRTQDVPARYVVGYSTGEPAGQNSFTVRGMNAHAWVEVYFPEVGWVQFDPTPADDRRQQERESLENRTGEPVETPTGPTPANGSNGTVTETGPGTGTPTDTSTPVGSEDGDGTEAGESDDPGERAEDEGRYSVDLNRSAVPGVTVEVVVTDDRRPVPDATVLFNGDAIGETGPNGTVTGEVPYTEQLNVTVVEPGQRSLVAPDVPTGDDGRSFAVDRPYANASTTFDLATNASVAVAGDVVTGNTVTVTALVDDVPVRDAAVTLDGEPVARTDRDGRAEVALPATPGNVTVGVERGSVTGNRTLSLQRLNVTTEPTAPLALPLTDVRVNATFDGEPVAGANVTVGGSQTTTGVDGVATAPLPLASSATVRVERYGQQRTDTYDGLFVNLGLAGLTLAVLVGGLVAAARRYGVTSRGILGGARQVGQWAVAAVVAIGSAADGTLDRLKERALLTVAHLRALVEGRRSLADLRDALRAWLRARAGALRSLREDGGVASVLAAANGGETTGAHATVRDSWGRFLGLVSIRRPHTRTPGEIAAHAVAVDDLPESEVTTVLTAFRAVEYGDRDPTERAPDVAAAVAAIEDHADGSGSDDAASGDRPAAPTEPGVAD